MSSFVRAGSIELRRMPSEEYLALLFKHSKTDDTGSRIRAQFAGKLKERDPSVGVLGLYCCDELVGGINYGHVESAYHKHEYSGRLDTVLTLPPYRGLGLGAVMMSGLMVHSYEALGDGLKHYSTIALHPAVRAFVDHLDFVQVPGADDYRYALDLPDHESRETFYTKAKQVHTKSLQAIRSKCMTCMRRTWSTPWCRPDAKAKAKASA